MTSKTFLVSLDDGHRYHESKFWMSMEHRRVSCEGEAAKVRSITTLSLVACRAHGPGVRQRDSGETSVTDPLDGLDD